MKVFFSFLILLSTACASDRPPSGGMTDLSPLQVIFSDPAPASTNVTTEKIRLTFNHEVPKRQLIKSLLFYPSVGNYDITMHGKEAEIKLYKPLKINQTYKLLVNKNLRDFQGSTFSSPYTTAFSTGQIIDTGTIGGKIFNENWSPASNAIVLAFFNHAENAETQNLLTGEPDYLVQANSSGAFIFNNIKAGSYRIFAVNDRNSDLRYNNQSEESSQTSSTFVSTLQAESASLMLRLVGVNGDTSTLVSCKPIAQQRLEISFCQPINTLLFDAKKIEIRHTSSNTLIPIVAWYSKKQSLFDREFIVITTGLKPNQPYSIRYCTDEKTGEIVFYSSNRSHPKQSLSVNILPKDQSNPAYLDSVWPSLGKTVILNFSHPIEESAVKRAVTLAKTRLDNQENIHFSLIKLDSRTFALKPEGEFNPGDSYSISVNPAIAAISEETNGKPVISRFRVATKNDTGTLSGTCFASGTYVIVEARTNNSASFYSTTALRARDGLFHYYFPELPPGSYTVSAFIPNGKKHPEPYQQWNSGSIVPYKPAEPFGLYPGTALVRAQWATTNIDIHITSSR